jgi:hypothetical protein
MFHKYLQYKDKLGGFYNKDQIQTITEDQVKQGMANFDVLIDSNEVSTIRNALDQEQKERERQLEKQRFASSFSASPPQEGTSKIGKYMMASVSPRSSDLSQFKSLSDGHGLMMIEEKVNEMEVKEDKIITGLFQDHFTKKTPK